MLSFTLIISSIFSIVLLFQLLQVIITKTIETIQNARDSY